MLVKNYWPKFGMSYEGDFWASDKNLATRRRRRYDMGFEWGNKAEGDYMAWADVE